MIAEIQSVLARLINDDEGATAVEYAIMIALIAAVIITVVGVIGKKANNGFQSVNAGF
jgi:pilus assembly protein Flp/PilA